MISIKRIAFLNHPLTNKIVFLLSIILFAYWYVGLHINVYQSAVLGAFYELLSLPMLGLLILLPVISILLMTKEKLNIRSLPLYSLLLSLATIVVIAMS
jgi:hypothetical protein